MQNSIQTLKSSQHGELNNNTNLLPKDDHILTGNRAEEPKCKMFKKTLIRIICMTEFISCLPADLAAPKIMERILESVWKMTQSHPKISPVEEKKTTQTLVLIGITECKGLGLLALAKHRVNKIHLGDMV